MEVNHTLAADPNESAYIGHLAESFLKVYASLLLVIGIPGNIICGIIMGGNKANRLTTRLLMIILSVADTAVLLTAVLRYWSIEMFDWDPRNEGAISCKLHVFAVAFSTDFAVGSLCAIAVERLLVVAFPHKANSVVTVTSVLVGMTSFGMLVTVKNLLHFWMMGLNRAVNESRENHTRVFDARSQMTTPAPPQFRCVSDPAYKTQLKMFMKIDLISFAVLPYIILFSSNVYIYLKLRKQQAVLKRTKQRAQILPNTNTRMSNPPNTGRSSLDRNNASKHEQATGLISTRTVPKRVKRRPESAIKLLTALTLIHVGCTLPGTIFTFVTSYFTNTFQHMSKDTHELVKVSLVMLIFTNNAINFFGYYASCASFRESFRNIYRCLFRCSDPPSTSSTGMRAQPTKCRLLCNCCSSTTSSAQPDRVLIVAPKPGPPANVEQSHHRQQTNCDTQLAEE